MNYKTTNDLAWVKCYKNAFRKGLGTEGKEPRSVQEQRNGPCTLLTGFPHSEPGMIDTVLRLGRKHFLML